MNGKEIYVSDQSVLDQSFIELGFPYKAENYRSFALGSYKTCTAMWEGCGLCAAAAEICYIAAGRFEAAWRLS